MQGIEGLVEGLTARGVDFEPLPATASFAGQQGVATGAIMDLGAVRSAFLRDSEGNLLALNEIVG